MADGVVEYILRLTDKTKAGTRSAIQGSEQLERQTERTAKAIDDLGDESAQTGRQLDRMGKESTDAGKKVAGLGKGLSGALSSVSGMTAGVGGLVAALGVGALIGTLGAATRAVFDFGQQVADLRNDIVDTATRSGIAATTLQGIRFAAEGAGVGFEELITDLDNFGRMMRDAASGTGAQADAFAALGVKVTDAEGNLRDVDSVFRETLSALVSLEGGAQRSALALDLFGGAGGRLIQSLGGAELEDFVQLAQDFGVDVGPEAAKSASDWQRASAELALVLDGVKASLFDAVGGADALFAAADFVIFAFEGIKGAASAASDSLSQSFRDVFAPLETLADALRDLLEGLQALGRGDFSASLSSLSDAAAGLGRALTETPEALSTASRGVAFGIGEAIAAGAQGAISGVTGAGADRVIALRLARARIRAGGPAGTGTGIGGPDGDGDGDGAATAEAQASREDLIRAASAAAGGPVAVGASAFEFGEVLREGARSAAEQMQATAAEAEATRLQRLEGLQTGIGAAGQIFQGDIGGGVSSIAGAAGMAGLGVAGAAVSGLQFIGEQGAEGIRDTLEGVKDALLAGLEALPELIGNVLPQFAVSLVSTLIPALVEAAPALFEALLTELPVAIAQALGEVLREGVTDESKIGRNIGAVVGGVIGFAVGGPVGAVVGAGAGGFAGQQAQEGVEREIEARGRRSARTASDGQASSARAADRLALQSTRRRRTPTTVQTNPFDQLAQQFDNQFGTYGRASAATIGAT